MPHPDEGENRHERVSVDRDVAIEPGRHAKPHALRQINARANRRRDDDLRAIAFTGDPLRGNQQTAFLRWPASLPPTCRMSSGLRSALPRPVPLGARPAPADLPERRALLLELDGSPSMMALTSGRTIETRDSAGAQHALEKVAQGSGQFAPERTDVLLPYIRRAL